MRFGQHESKPRAVVDPMHVEKSFVRNLWEVSSVLDRHVEPVY